MKTKLDKKLKIIMNLLLYIGVGILWYSTNWIIILSLMLICIPQVILSYFYWVEIIKKMIDEKAMKDFNKEVK